MKKFPKYLNIFAVSELLTFFCLVDFIMEFKINIFNRHLLQWNQLKTNEFFSIRLNSRSGLYYKLLELGKAFTLQRYTKVTVLLKHFPNLFLTINSSFHHSSSQYYFLANRRFNVNHTIFNHIEISFCHLSFSSYFLIFLATFMFSCCLSHVFLLHSYSTPLFWSFSPVSFTFPAFKSIKHVQVIKYCREVICSCFKLWN